MITLRKKGLAALVTVGLTWVVGFPLLITLLEALGYPHGWSLSSFSEFVHRVDEWQALWRSLWISACSVVLAAVVGVPLAFVFERTEFPGRRVLGVLVALPVALPPLVGVIAFLFLYGETGFITRAVQVVAGMETSPWRLSGPGAILLVHGYSMYVYFYLFTRAALARLDHSVYEAAAALGSSRVRSFLRVSLPLLRPALAGAALLTFMTALGSFSAPYIFGGGFRVMTTQIVASKLNGDIAMAQVESVVLASLACLGLWLMRRIDGGNLAVVGGIRGVTPARRAIRGRPARMVAGVLGWGLTLFLLLPHLTLLLISFVPPVTWTVEAIPPVLNFDNYHSLWMAPERLRPVINSIWMASLATAVAVGLGLLVAKLSLDFKGRFGRVLETILAIPWAIPGTVFAISLAAAFSVHSPLTGRLILVGTPWILPLAYLVRSLPVTGRSSLAGLRQLDRSMEEAAVSLGAGRWRILRRITIPLLKPALAAGASLAFITALGDFVSSIVLYTYDTRPISVEIFSSLRLQETGVAAVFGVLLMLVSASAFLLWGREERA
ncbi:MAG: iron ABC transporter permease [Thermoanaerobaculia bacterium]